MKTNKVNKKLAEIKSLWGNGEPVYSNIRIIEEFCIFFSIWKYRLTEGLYFKIKYFIQRCTRGYDDLDKWNAAWYISRKAIPVLQAWRNGSIMGTALKRHYIDRHGEIIEYKDEELRNSNGDIPDSFSEEEWRMIIDDIIFAFKFILREDDVNSPFNEEEYNKSYKRYKKGMKLLSIYFNCLWD